MIKVSDLIEWAQVHAIGRSVSYPEGWISGAALKNLGELVLKEEPDVYSRRDVGNRANLIEAWQDVTTMLLAMEGVRPEMSDRVAALAIARAVWLMLDSIIRHIDKTEPEGAGQ